MSAPLRPCAPLTEQSWGDPGPRGLQDGESPPPPAGQRAGEGWMCRGVPTRADAFARCPPPAPRGSARGLWASRRRESRRGCGGRGGDGGAGADFPTRGPRTRRCGTARRGRGSPSPRSGRSCHPRPFRGQEVLSPVKFPPCQSPIFFPTPRGSRLLLPSHLGGRGSAEPGRAGSRPFPRSSTREKARK